MLLRNRVLVSVNGITAITLFIIAPVVAGRATARRTALLTAPRLA